jgi:cell division control protein 6
MSDEVQNIFRRAKQGKVLFKNKEVLSPDYVPERLPFRENQIRQVAEVLAPILHGSKPSNLLLYGKTGTGKTAVARYVLTRLHAEAGADILVTYVNTRLAGTEYKTLAELCHYVGIDIPFTGISVPEVFERFCKAVKQKGVYVIVTLDEIDYLVKNFGDETLYEITRSSERLKPGNLTLVGISNDLNFKQELDPRVLSSLSEEEIVFPPYTVDELLQILHERAKIAFIEGAISQSAINLCAAMAGSEHGDARRAVDLLRIAGEIAEREGLTQIDDQCVKKASDKMEHERIEGALKSLPIQNKLILLAASRFLEGASTGEIYLVYSSLCKEVGLEPLTQRRVSGILSELDLLGLVQASVVSKGRKGRTKKVKLLIDKKMLEGILDDEQRST